MAPLALAKLGWQLLGGLFSKIAQLLRPLLLIRIGKKKARAEAIEEGMKRAHKSKKRRADIARLGDDDLDKRLRKYKKRK